MITPLVRIALAVCALVSLGACNMVMTDRPMFSKEDGVGAPPIRLGVWRSDKPDCPFDETLPQNQWPKCAGAEPAYGSPPLWQEVRGEPNLLQMPLRPPKKYMSGLYLYIAYRPLRRDAQGRVIAMKSWPVKCGPPPPPAPPPTPGPAGTPSAGAAALPMSAAQDAQNRAQLAKLSPTKSPLPGLTMNAEFGSCTPDSVAALRNAAKASEAWADDNPISHWVREPIPGDLPPLTQAALEQATSLRGSEPPDGSGVVMPAPERPAPPKPTVGNPRCGGISTPSDPGALTCE